MEMERIVYRLITVHDYTGNPGRLDIDQKENSRSKYTWLGRQLAPVLNTKEIKNYKSYPTIGSLMLTPQAVGPLTVAAKAHYPRRKVGPSAERC